MTSVKGNSNLYTFAWQRTVTTSMLLKYNIIIRVEWARKQETNLCNITVFHENESIVLTQQSADTYTNTAARLRTGRGSYDDILSVQLHVGPISQHH